MKYATLFILLGLAFVFLALQRGGWWLPLVWLGGSFVYVGIVYFLQRPAWLGKRSDGSMRWWVILLLLPYFLLTWGIWHLQRWVTRAPAFHQVAPGLWLGRRPTQKELPATVNLLVDLTAEFPRVRSESPKLGYHPLALLDACATDDASFRRAVEEVASCKGEVFIHCAQGHGRSATFAAAVLIARGLADDVDDAEGQLRNVRPGVRLSAAQRALVRQVTEQVRA